MEAPLAMVIEAPSAATPPALDVVAPEKVKAIDNAAPPLFTSVVGS